MSQELLLKAIVLHVECCEYCSYFGTDEFTEEENNQSILFLYDMLREKGEAGTIEWLIENEYLESEE